MIQYLALAAQSAHQSRDGRRRLALEIKSIMARVSIVLGIVLILLGLGGYFGTDRESVTALIPAFFGVPFFLLGLFGLREERLKLTMHIAVVLALLGLVGSARGLPGAWTLISGGEVERPMAVWVQTAMALLCAVFMVLAVKSFIDVRRARAADAGGQES